MYIHVCGHIYAHASIHTHTCVLVTQSCLTLCDPMNCSPPGSSVHGILQARILEWFVMPSARGSSQPRDKPMSLTFRALADRFFTTNATYCVSCSVVSNSLQPHGLPMEF